MHKKYMALGIAITYLAVGLLVSVVASGVLVTSESVRTSGILATANLGVYSDSACTQSLSAIDWGLVTPGATVSRTVYVKNLGTAQVTLSLSASSWNPAAANGPVSMSWNRQEAALTSGQVTSATLMLSVSSGVSGFTSFSVDAVITGTS